MKHLKLFLYILAVGAFLTSTSSFATTIYDTYNLGVLTVNDAAVATGSFGASAKGKSFVDTYDFTTASTPSLLDSSAFNFKTSVTNITNLSLTLLSARGTVIQTAAANSAGVASLTELFSAASTSYALKISGTVSGRSGGLYNVDVVSSAPEPATWAMMILGFGAVGFVMWKRRGTSVGFATAA